MRIPAEGASPGMSNNCKSNYKPGVGRLAFQFAGSLP